MKILISNDDGINAEGLRVLAKTLSRNHEVYVSAPASQMSATSHKISMHSKLYLEERQVEGAKEAWAITGTPADATKIGMAVCEKKGIEIDVVFSGINHGGNYGYDALYSGTIGAATEANISYKPAVAVSVNSHEPKYKFEYAAVLAAKMADQMEATLELLRNKGLEKIKTLSDVNKLLEECPELDIAMTTILTVKPRTISINVPDIPATEIKGVKPASLGPRDYDNLLKESQDEKGIYFEYNGTPRVYKKGNIFDGQEISANSDVMLMQEGYATITVLGTDLTDWELTENWAV